MILVFQIFQMQDGTQAVVQQPQAIQGGQVIQLGNPAAANTSLGNVQQHEAVATSTASTTTGNSGNQNIIMMVPGATGGSPTIQRIPLPGMQEIFFYNVVLSFVVIIIVSNKHITTKLVRCM